MSDTQEFCLRWSSYSYQLSEALRNLLDQEVLVDVTLACEGRSLRAHRAILSACSTYFQELFQESTHPHPIVILKDVSYKELEALVKFMYHGEVTVNHDILPGFLRTAETLHVRGLTDHNVFPSSPPIDSLKDNQRVVDGDTPVSDQDENASSINRLSPVHMKQIKQELPSTSEFHQSSRQSQEMDLEASANTDSIDNGIRTEQDTHSSIRQEDLPHVNQEQNYNMSRPMSTLDGLSLLVMPAMPDNSSQYTSACSQNQHQIQQQQHLQNVCSNSGSSRPFRQRVFYNQEQLLQLEAWYHQDRYPSGALMCEYADTLAAMVPNTPGSIGAHPLRQNVDYWFQNRRRKDFHPEVLQQREKKKLAKTLWGNYNGNLVPASTANAGGSTRNSLLENSVSHSNNQ